MTASDVRYLHRPLREDAEKPVCRECGVAAPCKTIRALGPDLLMPRLELPPKTLANGEQVWPGDPRFAVIVRSVYGECNEQVVEASSLVDALEKAKAIPLIEWLRDEAEED